MSLALRLAEFASNARLRSAELQHQAARALIDTVGVTIAGAAEPSFRLLADTLAAPTGEATILPTGQRASAEHAALLNGTAGHALDYDDVSDEITGHPSVVLISALLALAEAEHRAGADVLEAYAVGFQVGCAIARGLPVEAHYRAGWHATSTIGVLAATVACGRLLGLGTEQMRHSIGIASSMASGSRQNFGTMTKPLHAGLAARDAVIAARLAGNGFTADQDVLDAPLGYFALYGAGADPSAVENGLGQIPLRVSVKKYPCCYGTHRMADAALSLFAEGVRADSVQSVAVTVEPGGQRAIIHHRPTTGLQGKFSGEYVTAACLLDGSVRLSSFTDEAVCRSAAQSLLKRVSLAESASPLFGPASFDHAYACLELTLADGSTLRERCDIPRGDARSPLSDADVEAKFRDCLAHARTRWDAEDLLRRLWTIAERPVAQALEQPLLVHH